ncbi:hypothetical protein lerEdw1_008812 [Lerista edwardsae]|nr:hypothetical protein lerEdw1_008812 [Lerista edwardsae]
MGKGGGDRGGGGPKKPVCGVNLNSEKKRNSVMASATSEYTIGGVKILFPCKAYPSQLAMMNAIVKGLNSKQHCLLESPTGSGKSLALLCSALSWQQSLYDQPLDDLSLSKEFKNPETLMPCRCSCHADPTTKDQSSVEVKPGTSSSFINSGTVEPINNRAMLRETEEMSKSTLSSKCSAKKRASFCESEDNDFKVDRKRIRSFGMSQQTLKHKLVKGVQFVDALEVYQQRKNGELTVQTVQSEKAVSFPLKSVSMAVSNSK